MDIVEEYLEKHRIGFPTFEKLFGLKMDKLLEVVYEITSHHEKSKYILNEKPRVYKEIENDEPKKIIIASWGSLEITPTGIYHKPEHGCGDDVVLFNKFFTLSLE
jgi:hypothetical protein